MTASLAGRTAIVTGAGRGIGRAAAQILAKMGASVVVNDLGAALDGRGADSAPAEQVAREIREAGGRAVANRDSVAEWEGAKRIVQTALDSFGSADILVNNAGLSAGKPIWELDAELFERVCDSHVKGTFFCTRHAVPHMKAKGWGRIVNLVSRAGIIGVPGNAAYGAGKGGVFGITNVVSRDLAPFGITVNAVNPSSTETRMVTNAVEAGRKAGGDAAARAENLLKLAQKPEDVGVLIASLCSEEAAGINGQIFFVAKGEIGLFQPLSIGQKTTKEGSWAVDELVQALGKFQPYPLDVPYSK
jgi:NAD(P)-dependent dehydrogenase (short-subunit alcohol dehydrogenase family)